MAGAGYKVFNAGDILTSSDVNTYLQQQVVMVFNDAAARTTALTSVLAEGMVTYLKDTNTVEVYDGSAWVSTTGDITGITAGTGITVTNPTSATPTVSIDTAVVPRLANANTFTTGAQTIQTGGTGNVGLIVQAHVAGGQTANLQEWRDSSATVLSSINSNGHFNGIQATLNQNNAGAIVLRVRAASSQTADLQQWQNSAGSVLSFVRSDGVIFASQGLQGTAWLSAGSFISGANLISNIGTASNVGVLVRGAASQTANLQEWQNSAGTAVALVASSGRTGLSLNNYINTGTAVYIGDSAYGFSAEGGALRYYTSAAAGGGHVWLGSPDSSVFRAGIYNNGLFLLRGISGQTVNLQEWQSSAGTVLSWVDSSGSISIPRTGTFRFNGGVGTVRAYIGSNTNNDLIFATAGGLEHLRLYGGAFPSGALLTTGTSTAVGLAIRGVASQTANLQEWQNSAGTVLASVLSGGNMTATDFRTVNTYGLLGEANAGGRLYMVKATAANNNPGAGIGVIYFRDGTNAGTLKLVVRAGAAGAETTILDNIPQ